MTDAFVLERTVDASPEEVWELWTTAEGIERWWSPDGFTTEVRSLDLRVGGELVYAFRATAPEQIAFLERAGLPLVTEARKTFTELERPSRLAYTSVVDFVPDAEPYEQLTTIELRPAPGGGTHVVETADGMHDDVWTARLREGRENELANLAELVARRGGG